MHVVIPMSGIGKRFQEAGYDRPKPLIVVDGKPIIEFVVSMFPGETKFSFICNREHLETTPLQAVLEGVVEKPQIISIEPHKKGPVYAVAQRFDLIDDEEEVIVNYCDFYSDWDYQDFLRDTRGRSAEGAVPSYRGFHPHMLGTDNYAFIKDTDRWMEAIQEKKPFTDDRMKEYASNGTYYFRHGRHVKKYFQQLMDEGNDLNGEFYVSMVYNLLIADGLPCSVYEVPHMLQWGTPKDLEEYQEWSDYFRACSSSDALATRKSRRAAGAPALGNSSTAGALARCKRAVPFEPSTTVLVPMAGRGARFQQEGYSVPKPLIEVNGKPMVVEATQSLPAGDRYVFVVLEEHLRNSEIENELMRAFPKADIVSLTQVTEGQACTCAVGLIEVTPPVELDKPLIVGACDNGMLWNDAEFQKLIEDENVAAIAFSFRNHPASKRNPHMYGWLAVDEKNRIKSVSVKVPISDTPGNDHAIVGSFYFRKARYLLEGLDQLQKKNKRINNEFYVDSLIGELVEQGLDCRVFEVDYYVCWGTPDDLRVFEYWQGFFDKCPWHPYKQAQPEPKAKVERI